jgi:tripeptidyl-peptidase-1
MRYHTGNVLSQAVLVLSVLSAGLACHATPSSPPWDEILVKHKRNAIPDNWLSMSHPPNGTTIELHIVLKPNRENALIDALHEVSQPRHPKHVLSLGLLR